MRDREKCFDPLRFRLSRAELCSVTTPTRVAPNGLCTREHGEQIPSRAKQKIAAS
jgi:hypothetical protein